MPDTELQQLSKTDRNPVQESRYQDLLKQGGGLGGDTDLLGTAKQILGFQQQAAQPAVQSLQASIPEVSNKFATERSQLETQKNTLKQRYSNLLDELKGRENVDIASQQRVTSQEFGRRGIPLSSGLFDTSLNEAISPIRQYYTGQIKDVGLGQEEGLQNLQNLIAQLTGQETGSIRDIRNTIAQLQ